MGKVIERQIQIGLTNTHTLMVVSIKQGLWVGLKGRAVVTTE